MVTVFYCAGCVRADTTADDSCLCTCGEPMEPAGWIETISL